MDRIKHAGRIKNYDAKRNKSFGGRVKSKQCPECKQYGVRVDSIYCGFNCKRIAGYKAKGYSLNQEVQLYVAPQKTKIEKPQPQHPFVSGNCGECGQHFVMIRPGQSPLPRYCSALCSRRNNSRNGKHRRKVVVKATQREPIYKRQVFEKNNYTCQLCKYPLDMGAPHNSDWAPSIDHIFPLAKGGTHTYDNLQAAHRICNSYKNDKIPTTANPHPGVLR
jgi:5-methylcytosine-specific restriction endonuclease McrA